MVSASGAHRLSWNARYERSKARLVCRLEALLRHTERPHLAIAEWTIVAIERLPAVGRLRGTLFLESRVDRRPGDSDFLYTLSVSDKGFVLGYHENVLLDSGRRREDSTVTLVHCAPEGSEAAPQSHDDKALAKMRAFTEKMAGHALDDDFWQAQVDSVSDNPDFKVPNGIESWLEMLPVGDNGDAPESLVVRWTS